MSRIGEDGPWAIPHRRPPVWVGDVVAALFVVAGAFLPFPAHEFRADSPLVLVVALLPAVLLPLRRRWPLPILAACLACYGVAALLGTIAPGVVLAAAIAMYGVATRSTRRRTLIITAVAVPAILALSMLAAIGDVFDPRTFQFAFVLAFAAAAGDATRSRREYIREMTERALRAERTRESEALRQVTEERLRIARDLHDAVAHQISVISLNAGVASTSLETRPEKTREALASIRRASRAVLAEIGDLLEMLRSVEGGEGETSVRPPQPGLDQLDDLIASFHETGLEVSVRREGDLSAVPLPIQRIAYLVAALRAGASGFIGKGAEPEEIVRAVRAVHAGDALLSPTATRALITRYVLPTRPSGQPDVVPPEFAHLTEREREVLLLVARGRSNQEIAEDLVISPHTAKTHVNRIMAKLYAHDRAQLVIAAYESGLLTPGS